MRHSETYTGINLKDFKLAFTDFESLLEARIWNNDDDYIIIIMIIIILFTVMLVNIFIIPTLSENRHIELVNNWLYPTSVEISGICWTRATHAGTLHWRSISDSQAAGGIYTTCSSLYCTSACDCRTAKWHRPFQKFAHWSKFAFSIAYPEKCKQNKTDVHIIDWRFLWT